MENLKIDRSKLYTQSEYAKKMGVTPPAVSRMIREGRVKVVQIKGAKLIYVD